MITFTEEEVHKIHQSHDDALVVTIRVGKNNAHQILINGCSFVDVLSKFAFNKLGLTDEMLKPSHRPPSMAFLGISLYPIKV